MSESLPAVPAPTDLDGWTSDDVLAHLDNVVLSFKRGRIEVGLLLWKLRTLEPSDPAYGAKVAPLAEKFDVTVATLARWRQAAEEEFGLVAALAKPKNETAGQRGSVARGRATGRESKHVLDVDSKAAGADPTEALGASAQGRKIPAPPDPQGDLQTQLRATVDGLVTLLGLDLTEKLLRMQLKRLAVRTAPPATAAPAAASSAACIHPKKDEQLKGWGVLCGVCKTKLR